MRQFSGVIVLFTISVAQALAEPTRHASHTHSRRHKEPIGMDLFIDKRGTESWGRGEWGEPTSAATPPPAPASSTVSTTSSISAPAIQASTSDTITATGSSPSESAQLTSADSGRLESLGFQAAGRNARDSSAGVWIGAGGAYTNEFTNNYSADIILVVWGPSASWVNTHTPLITVSLTAQGGSSQVSFADQEVGAWSAVYPDTPLVNGQIANTWGEYTFSSSGVIDVSRLVNGTGYSMEVIGPQCTTNMDTCVFTCTTGSSCTTGFVLENCGTGSQPGVQEGLYEGADSGGCGWNGARSASFKTSFGALASN